jgi:hypothetical protein
MQSDLRHAISVPGSIRSLMDYTPVLEHALHDKQRQLTGWHALMASAASVDGKEQGGSGQPTTSQELSQLQLQMSKMQLHLDPEPHQHGSPHPEHKLPPSLPEIHANSSKGGSSKSVSAATPVGSRSTKSMLGAGSTKSITTNSRHVTESASVARQTSVQSGGVGARGPAAEEQQAPPPLQQPLVAAAVQADAGPVRVLASDNRRPVAVMRTHRRANQVSETMHI